MLFVCSLLAVSLLGADAQSEAPSERIRKEAAASQMGRWVWTDKIEDNQICRLWRSFDIPAGAIVTSATLYISVDNGYKLLLDGREIGQGSDWRCITIFDLTLLLKPGQHVLAVEAHNDTLGAGLNCGLHIELPGRDPIRVISDESWSVAPNTDAKWAQRKQAPANWPKAHITLDQARELWPKTISIPPPLRLPVRYFWQAAWFQITLATVCGLAILTGIWLFTRVTSQNEAQRLLHQERIRIAQDIHDDIGSRVTELLLLGEVSRREKSDDPVPVDPIELICDQARGLSVALDEVVWAVNAKRDTVKDFISHVCKHAQAFLSTTAIRCRLDVEAEIPASALPLHVRRNLFLAVKEALNNSVRHSQADELVLRIYRREHHLFVEVADNGRGFDVRQVSEEGNGLANMERRLEGINGTCEMFSEPDAGCRIVFSVPIPRDRHPAWPVSWGKGQDGSQR